MDALLENEYRKEKRNVKEANERVASITKRVKHNRGRANALKAEAKQLESNLPALEEKLADAVGRLDSAKSVFRPIKERWKAQRHLDWIAKHL
jgi:chromosome segregation ATPase